MLRLSLLVAAGVAGVVLGMLSKPKRRTRCFSIKRTKSEVGYTFWILEGFGRHKCFVLFDTWQEAIDEANRRLSARPLRPMSVRASRTTTPGTTQETRPTILSAR
jgi:hypothetical protein